MTTEQIRNKAQQLVNRLETEGYSVGKKVKEVLSNPKASPKTVKYYLSSTYIKQHAGYYRQVGGVNIDTPLFTASQRGDFETKLAEEIVKSARLLGNPSFERTHQVDVYYKWVKDKNTGKRHRVRKGRRIYSPARAADAFKYLLQLENYTNIRFTKNLKNVNYLPELEVDMDKFKKALRIIKNTDSNYYENLLKVTVQNRIFTKEGRIELAAESRKEGVETLAQRLAPGMDIDTFNDVLHSFLQSSDWLTFKEQKERYYEAMQVETAIRTWKKIDNNNNQFNKTLYGDGTPDSSYLGDSSHSSAVDLGRAGELFQSYALKHGFFI